MTASRSFPSASQAPVFASQAPLAVIGLLVAVVLGVLLAKEVMLGVAFLTGLVYAPIVLLDIALGVGLWVPLLFLERVPALSRGPAAVSIMVGLAWLATLPSRRHAVAAMLRRHAGLVFLLLLLLAWTTSSVVWSVDPGATASTVAYWWIAAGVFFVIATSLTERRHLIGVCGAFVVGALLSVAVGFVPGAFAVPSDVAGTSEASRLAGSYGDPNFLAAGLVPAMALAGGLAVVTTRRNRRVLLLGAAGFLAIGLLATGSRGGMLAAAVAALGALLVARGRRLSVLAVAALVIAVGGIWVAATSSSSLDRVRDFGTGTGRVDLWTVAVRMGDAQPVTGVGLDGFPEASAKYLRRPGRLQSGSLASQLVFRQPHEAHNTYLQLFAETGLVGVGLLLAMLLAALRATWLAARTFERLRDRRFAALAWSVLIAQVAALITSAFITNPHDKRTWVLLALGPALMTVASRSARPGSGIRESG